MHLKEIMIYALLTRVGITKKVCIRHMHSMLLWNAMQCESKGFWDNAPTVGNLSWQNAIMELLHPFKQGNWHSWTYDIDSEIATQIQIFTADLTRTHENWKAWDICVVCSTGYTEVQAVEHWRHEQNLVLDRYLQIDLHQKLLLCTSWWLSLTFCLIVSQTSYTFRTNTMCFLPALAS